MRITPLDIQQRNFSVRFRGFHREEVSAFLELIREEMEDLLRENASLKDRIQRGDDDSNKFRDLANNLGQTLQEARESAEDYKSHGRKEADLFLKKAEDRAKNIVRTAQGQIQQVHEEIADLKMMRRRFHEDMKETLEHFRQIIEGDLQEMELYNKATAAGRSNLSV